MSTRTSFCKAGPAAGMAGSMVMCGLGTVLGSSFHKDEEHSCLPLCSWGQIQGLLPAEFT